MINGAVSVALFFQLVLVTMIFFRGASFGRYGLVFPLLALADGYLLIEPVRNVIHTL